MSVNKVDKADHYRPPGYGITKIPSETEETKNIRKIGNEISQIHSETEAIKKGEIKPTLPSEYANWLKRLNVV